MEKHVIVCDNKECGKQVDAVDGHGWMQLVTMTHERAKDKVITHPRFGTFCSADCCIAYLETEPEEYQPPRSKLEAPAVAEVYRSGRYL